MRTPILSDRAAAVTHKVGITLIIGLSLITLSATADPYEPVRAALVGVAGVAVALAATGLQLPRGLLGRLALGGLALAVLGTLLAAVVGGIPSAVFGVHGRFQGLTSGLAGLVAFGVGLMSSGRIRFTVRVIAGVLAVQCMIVLVQAMSGDVPVGTMGNQVLAGAWIAVAASMTAAGARTERGTARWLLVAAVGLAGLTLGVAGSRGAWVGLAVGLLAVVAVSFSWKQAAGVALGLLLLVAGALAAGGEAAAKLDPSGLVTGSARTRALIWQGTAQMIMDHPLTGVGPGRYLYEFTRYQPAEHAALERGVRPDQAHSVPLHVAAESGIPAALGAVVFFGAAVIAAVRRSTRRDGVALVALGGLAAWCGQALFGISTVETDALAFLCAGVALARLSAAPAPGTADHGVQAPSAGARRSASARTVDPIGVGGATSALPGAVGSRSAQRALLSVLALGIMAATLTAGAGWYLVADVAHLRGLEAFYSGDMRTAWSEGSRAVEFNPLVDIYRIGAADAALYGAASADEALALVDAGLRLEPESHDLALERARLLKANGAAASDVLAAHRAALDLYPLGIDAGHLAIEAAIEADERSTATDIARRMLEVYPDDAFAASALEGAADGP